MAGDPMPYNQICRCPCCHVQPGWPVYEKIGQSDIAGVMNVWNHIQEYFPGASLSVRHTNYDVDVQLCVMIPTKMKPKKALKQLNKLDDDWWIEESRRDGPRVVLDVEYE